MGTEVLTHTKRRDFKNCRRYFLHRHVHHLTTRRQKRGRRRGSIFGDLLLGVRQTEEIWQDGLDVDRLQGFVWSALETTYEQIADEGMLPAEELEELEVERVKMEVMLVEYVRHYGIDQRRELEYEVPLRNPRTNRTSRAFRLGGKIDGVVVVDPTARHARIVEDKLVGQIQRVMIERLPLDDQATEYVDTFMAKGWTAEVDYRHTRFPNVNPKPAKTFKTKGDYPGETLDEYQERLTEDVRIDRPEFYFDQQILHFPSRHMEEYQRERWGVAQQIIEARRHVGTPREVEFFEKNPSRCWEYGGCEFIPLCTKQEEAINLYVVQPDNPELSHGKDEGSVTSEYGPVT